MIPVTAQNTITPYFKIEVYPTLRDLTVERNQIQNITETGVCDFVQISITEKEREAPTASITLIDNTGTFDVLLNRYSSLFLVEYGLRIKPNPFINISPLEVNGELKRVMIFSLINKSVSCSDGLVTYSFGLKGTSEGQNKDKTYTSGTIKNAILETCKDMGIEEKNIIIDFPEMETRLSNRNQLTRVGKTNIRFIYEIASKYNVLVYYNSNFERNPLKIYIISFGNILKYDLPRERGLEGNYHYFDYGSSESNCISIDFDCNNGAGQTFGSGSQVTVDPKSGAVRVEELSTGTDQVTTYVLNTEKIKSEVRGQPVGAAARRVAQIISSDFDTDWESLKREYFIKKNTSTVSSSTGQGYTAKCDVVPNPMYQIGDTVFLSPEPEYSLIPPTFQSKEPENGGSPKGLWRISAIEQTISSDGYDMNVEISR
jgi:hypothetical protein